MPKIRVLVVEDSLTVRKRLCEVLSADAELEVIGEAGDGKEAIELCTTLRPDVITLDMILPVMSGLAATEYIMAYYPTPILVVSCSTNRGELFKTYEALAAGAVDVLEKYGDEDATAWEARFVRTVKLVSRIRVISHPRMKLANGRTALEKISSQIGDPLERRARAHRVVAIGASTGGPGAIVKILSSLPGAFKAPILFVLHISDAFAVAFAEWLEAQTNRRVLYAKEGMPAEAYPGCVVMAPPDRHLLVRRGRFHLTADPERHSCRPSIDTLFESVAAEYGERAVGCLLTGMGRDGADGLLAMKRAGAFTIAQDEATSVVYGMPKAAADLQAVDAVLPLPQIGPALTKLTAPEAG